MRLAENFRWHTVGGMPKNQAGFTQFTQEIPMAPAEYLESSALVGRNARHLQDHCGEAGNSQLVRLRQLFQPSHVFLGNMRLLP